VSAAMRSRTRAGVLPACLVVLGLSDPGAAGAQGMTAGITGYVRDAQGGAVAGAELVATHVATRAPRHARSAADGSYTFTTLVIGVYDVSCVAAGFKKVARTGVELHIGDVARLDMALELGELAEEVSVSAEAPLVQLATSEQGGLISGEQVRGLQLNGRSFMTLLELLPGVSSDLPDRSDPNTSPALSINGARSTASNFNIDGGSNSDVVVGSSSLNTFTSIDTIEEVKVITSTSSAQYGQGGFSQVNVVTKSGTRDFRGSAYEYFRHDALSARDFLSGEVLPLRLNDFGYTIGGPVTLGGYNRDRNRTFFFFSQEWNLLSARGEAVNTTVPTEAMVRGDFSGLGPGPDGAPGTADDPVIDPTTGIGFPGGVIPGSRIDPNAQRLLALYPAPNFAGPGSLNYTSAEASRQRWRQELIRLDHHFSPSWRGYVRYAQDSAFIRNPYGGSGLRSITTRFPGIAQTQADRPGRNLVINMTNILGPAWLSELNVTYGFREFDMRSTSAQADRAALGLTIPEVFPANDGNVLPSVTLGSGFATLNVPRVSHKTLHNLEASEMLTWISGRHSIKAGGVYAFGANTEQRFSPNTNGAFTFTTSFARHPVANLLLGLPSTYNELERLVISESRFSMLEGFVQDDFKVIPRLTLNLGLRWSNFFNPHDADDQISNFLPARYDSARAPQIDRANGRPVPGTGDPLNGIVVAAQDSPYGRRVTTTNTNLLGPRVGFAWDPFGTHRTSVRGAFGIYYTRPLIGTFINNTFDNPPFSRTVTLQSPGLSELGGREAPAGAPDLTALGDPLPAPRMEQWTLGVQQQVAARTVLSVSYVGSRGSRLLRPIAINDPAPGAGAAQGAHVNAVRPYLGYGGIVSRQSTGRSRYHSLQATARRQVSKGLSLGLAYTLSRSRDDGSSDRDATDIPPNSADPQAEWGPSNFDRTHVFTVNYIWRLPSTSGRGARGVLLNGWELSGITRAFSGKPFDVVMTQDVAGIGAVQNQRPDVIADTGGPGTIEQWFNTGAFARPATGTFGNMPRNSMRGPGLHRWDVAVFKGFLQGRRVRPQLRVEAFNVFNRPSYTAIGNVLTTTSSGVNPAAGNFGVVTGTGDARVIQLALRATF